MSKRLPQSYFGEEDDDDECVDMAKGEKFSSYGSKGSTSLPQKKQKTKGPLDMFFTPNPTNFVKARKEGRDQGRQQTLNEMCRKELRNKVCRILRDSSVMVVFLFIYSQFLIVFISCMSLLVNLVRI